jgi:hypothetical protein
MTKQVLLSVLVFLALVGSGMVYRLGYASDHDDGEIDLKGRALNLTDHYVWKDGNGNLVFVQSSNPRSLPGQQYFFSNQAQYELHLTRVANKTTTPTGNTDMIFRFGFGNPTATNTQAITFTVVNGANVVGTATGTTTNLTNSQAGTTTNNSATIGGQKYVFFAGHRQDSFFFDVERFFQVRSFLISRFVNYNVNASLPADCTGHVLGSGGGVFNPSSCAPDFTKNYNVNSIILQAPIAALQANGETTFDTWSIITYPNS